MTAEIVTCGVADTRAGAPRRQSRLDGFHPTYRRYIVSLASCSPEIEDLAESFPALLLALVSGYATAEKREHAFNLVSRGAPLREAADALGLAWWMRKLPARALVAPLPVLPSDPEFALRISNLLPSDPGLASVWFSRVSQAFEAAGPDYALWIARQHELTGPPDDLFMYLAAWAWYSTHPGLVGHRVLRKPWSADMSFKRAREELAIWRQRVRLVETLGTGIELPWLANGTACGLDFVALRTVEDFIAESQALENCLDQYADQLHTGLTAVYSVRKGTRRVACVEIGLHDEEVSMPTIVQLRAARNRRAPPEVWQAAFAWLGGQRLEPLAPERHKPRPMQRAEARRQLWRPYLQFLEGTRHAEPFRQAVQRTALTPRRRMRGPPLRPAAMRPALELAHHEEREPAETAGEAG